MLPVQALEQGEADFEALIKTHKDKASPWYSIDEFVFMC